MKSTIIYSSIGLALLSVSQAAITVAHHYELGEAGSLSGSSRAQDSVGSAHFLNNNGAFSAVNGGTASPGSTAYVSTASNAGNQGNYGAANQPNDLNNFAVDIWTRTANVTQNANVFVTNGNVSKSLKMGILSNGNWGVSYHGIGWVGGVTGAGQAATANEWTRLTVIRYNGTSSLYIDEVLQGGTSASDPTWDAPHLGIQSGGLAEYEGDMDDLRIWDFDHTTDSLTDVRTAVFAVPEPSSTALLGLGGLALMLRRRK